MINNKDLNYNIKLFFIGTIMTIMIMSILIVVVIKESQQVYPVIDIKNFTETLEIINDNCGSVFFTKQFGNEDFTIYKQECKIGGFCKSGYVTIESCLDYVNVATDEGGNNGN